MNGVQFGKLFDHNQSLLQICREITAGLGIHPGLALAIAARSGGPLFEVTHLHNILA